MDKPKRNSPYKEYTEGWGIFRCGYWLVCPTYTLAVIENDGKHKGIVKVYIKEKDTPNG